MFRMLFNNQENLVKQVLCLGAHSDDIEIGCGGTILKLIQLYPGLNFNWIVFSASGNREKEALVSAKLFLNSIKDKKIKIKEFRDGYLPYSGAEIKDYFEQIKKEVSPDLIFTHYRNDSHQDHRLISELTWNTFRNHLILEYEIPKYDGDLNSPNIFVHLSESMAQAKIQYILNAFGTQYNKQWFTEDTFLAILRLRGIESNAPEKYAEAFYCRKMIF